MIAGLTPCHVAVGHRLLTPNFTTEVSLATRFYDPASSVAWRLGYLRAKGFAYVVLPAGRAFRLGTPSPWKRAMALPQLEIFELKGHP